LSYDVLNNAQPLYIIPSFEQVDIALSQYIRVILISLVVLLYLCPLSMSIRRKPLGNGLPLAHFYFYLSDPTHEIQDILVFQGMYNDAKGK
jgi:hypothetical protein